ncbi:MAG: ATP-binding protein [Cyanobacteriota bacterium]|nr:ATP-binding protein [Cyanobacteriota bacterium]
MSKPKLHSAKTFNLLIVANGEPDAAFVAETLRSTPAIAFNYNIALSKTTYRSLLHSNSYHAVLCSHAVFCSDAPSKQEIAPEEALVLLHSSGQQIPFILISETLEDTNEHLRAQIADCVLRDRISLLPEILQHRLLPPPPLVPSPQSAMARLSQALQDASSTDEFLARVAPLLRETLNIQRCSLLQLDAEEQMRVRYVFPAGHQPETPSHLEGELERHHRTRLEAGHHLILPCLEETAQPAAVDAGSLLLVPLWSQQSYLGVLYLHHGHKEHQWTQAELDWAKTVAVHCAIALRNSQLSQHLQRHQRWHWLLHRVGASLNSTRSTDSAFAEAIEHIGETFGVEQVLLARVGEEQIVVTHEWRSQPDWTAYLHASVPAAEWQELLAPESPYCNNRYFQTSSLAEYCAEKEQTRQIVEPSQARSSLAIAIFARDRLWGSLILQTARSRTFSLEEINTLSQIADQLALAAAIQQEEQLQQEVEERTQQLEVANQAKSEFLSSMSHELRAPLTSVIGFARVLLEQIYGKLNSKQTQYISAIADSGEHLLSLINDLLDISKIEANREELYPETLSVEEICLSSMALLEERAEQAGLQLHFDLHPDVTVCYADQRRLKQILVNLLSNAIKFTESGSVTLKVEPRANRLEFSVTDTGIGISQADLDTLFQPFQQIQTPLHRKHKGSGLGLALSRKLARLHGGDIEATSKEGKGSCFTLSLPMPAEAASGIID